MVLVGPSGCGKSTSLRMLAGLEEVNDGQILIGDRDVTHLPPKDRDIAMVFQNYALYPHMTVADNMGFALKMAGVDKDERTSACRRGRRAARAERAPRPQAEGDVGWPAPARRDGPGDRPQPAGLLHGRAAVEPRCQAARQHPHADRRTAAAARRHHRLRHARPGRGDDDGRSGGRHEGRRPAAGRHPTAPRTTIPCQPLRRRLHRIAGDEPARGQVQRRGRRRQRPHGAGAGVGDRERRSTREASRSGSVRRPSGLRGDTTASRSR